MAKTDLQTGKPVTIINPDQYIDFQLPTKITPKTGYLAIYAEFSNKTGYVDIKEGLILLMTKYDLGNITCINHFANTPIATLKF